METGKTEKYCRSRKNSNRSDNLRLWDVAGDSFYSIPEGEFYLGKSRKCQIILPYPTISRIHAKAKLIGDRLIISDENSSNGIIFQNIRVEKTKLEKNKMLILGNIPLFLVENPGTELLFRKFRSRDGKVIKLVNDLKKLAPSNLPVLVKGESGTGKELVAKMVHDFSSRSQGSFIPLNCGAIPEKLIESELFGHVRGAFSGAEYSRKGVVARADGGTLFLDEIGELKKEHQSSLLRFLETGKYRAVGSDREQSSDARIVTATHKDLEKEIQEEKFRLDLYYRLAGFEVRLPPLRERLVDIPLLLEYFNVSKPDEVKLMEIMDYSWPGNIRQLKLMSQVAKLFGWERGVARIRKNKQRESVQLCKNQDGSGKLFDSIQKEAFKEALNANGGNISATARFLGIPRTTFINKMKKIGMR
ncbi:MAG: sigma 54-interacting transcriptional regulator [Myxococcota bacterium]